MKWVICFSFLVTAAFAHMESGYEKHFPRDVYEYVAQKEFIGKEYSGNVIEKQYAEEIGWIGIRLEEMDGNSYALIDYRLEKATDNFSGMQVAYQNGQVIAYVIFDENGRDYLAFPPVF